MLETHGCQGGAHGGYTRAGWDVTGVDIAQLCDVVAYLAARVLAAETEDGAA